MAALATAGATTVIRITSYNVCYTKLLRFENKEYNSAFAKVAESNNWTLVLYAPENEFMEDIDRGSLFIFGISGIILIIVLLITIRTSTMITKPISIIGKRIELLSQGDLNTPVPSHKLKSEIGLLYNSCVV